MVSKKVVALSLMAVSSLALSGCETSDDRKLAQGQACLDSSNSTNALQCKTYVDGLNSDESNMIRCSADFIYQGFTGTRIANSIGQIKNSGGAQDGTTSMISFLVFTKTDPSQVSPDTTADLAISDCTAAKSRSMLRLATATKLATKIATAANIIGSINPDDPNAPALMQTAVNNLANGSPSTQDLIAIGQTVQLASSAYCGDGSSYVGTDVCNDILAAVNSSSDPQAIAQALLQKMKK